MPISCSFLSFIILVTMFFTSVTSQDYVCPPTLRNVHERETSCSYSPECRDYEIDIHTSCHWGFDPCFFGTCYKKCVHCACPEGHRGPKCDPINLCDDFAESFCGKNSKCEWIEPGQYSCTSL